MRTSVRDDAPFGRGQAEEATPAFSLSPHGAAVLREPLHHSPNAATPQGVHMHPVDQVLTFAFIAYTAVRFAVGFGPG